MLISYRNWSRYTVNFLGNLAAEDRGKKVSTTGVKIKVSTISIENRCMNTRKIFNISTDLEQDRECQGSVIQVGSLVT